MIFEEILKYMENPNKESLEMSINNCHIKGCFSLVINGCENGLLTRVFVATKKIKPFDIQFHSHRYDLRIGVIHGVFNHHIATEDTEESLHYGESVRMKSFDYTSPLNGGNGLKKLDESNWNLKTHNIPVGGELFLPSELIHSVSCDKGSIWVVQELGFVSDSSTVLGNSFSTEGLYSKPEQFQINNMYEQVFEKLKKLV